MSRFIRQRIDFYGNITYCVSIWNYNCTDSHLMRTLKPAQPAIDEVSNSRHLTPVEQALARGQSNNENGDAVSTERALATFIHTLRVASSPMVRAHALNMIAMLHGECRLQPMAYGAKK